MLNAQRLLRSGAAIGAIGLLAMVLAAPASADSGLGKVGTIAQNQGDAQGPHRYIWGTVGKGRLLGYPIQNIGITIPVEKGEQRPAYCIDIDTGLNLDQQDKIYQKSDWREAKHIKPGRLDKINWILHNSYPAKSADDVLKMAGQKGQTPEVNNKLVYAATQAAVWNLSDNFTLANPADDDDSEKGKFSADEYALIQKIYTYLLKVAEKTPNTHILALTPKSASGQAGNKVGPYEVQSNVGDVNLDVEGGKAVNGEGKELQKVANGGKFWLIRQDAGAVTVTAKGYGLNDISHVYVNQKKPNSFQKIIVPATKRDKVYAKAKGTFTAVPVVTSPSPTPTTPAPEVSKSAAPPPPAAQPSLPVTGVAVAGVAGAGVLLLAAGGGLLIVRKRRKVNFEA